MAEQLRFQPSVADDLREAIKWYDDISLVLGNRFRNELDSRSDDIHDRPKTFGYLFSEVRCARLRRFPHLILFREIGETIYIFWACFTRHKTRA
jgi:hypothetical protein